MFALKNAGPYGSLGVFFRRNEAISLSRSEVEKSTAQAALELHGFLYSLDGREQQKRDPPTAAIGGDVQLN
jgi:hypothetical protein